MAGMSAEVAWRQAVAAAATAIDAAPATSILPPGTIQQLEEGRAVVLKDWLSAEETAALRTDQIACLEAGHFKYFTSNIHRGKILSMPSFFGGGKEGAFADPKVGDFAVRQRFMKRMATVKAALATQLHDRPTLADDYRQTHEIQYLHYQPGAQVFRHTDDRHVELKRPNGSRLQKKPDATRRSVTWLVYLNDEWDPSTDGGQLRVHERAQPAVTHVGASDSHLQVGWLRATATDGERPVFLDPFRGPGPENCMLFTRDAEGNTRDLSQQPFDNSALRLLGGDLVARPLMVDDPADQKRFHLIDAPRSSANKYLPQELAASLANSLEDGGERIRDIVPSAGTLVLFDSVSLPHEVLATNRLRYGMQGWFHEKLYY